MTEENKTTAPAKTNASAQGKQVEMKGLNGEKLGFTVDLAPPDGEGDDTASLAKRVRGWSTFEVEGESFKYSKLNATALLNRYPHFAEQLRRA